MPSISRKLSVHFNLLRDSNHRYNKCTSKIKVNNYNSPVILRQKVRVTCCERHMAGIKSESIENTIYIKHLAKYISNFSGKNK